MAYCTKQDLMDRFGERELLQLTDRATPPAGVIDDTVVARAIADATALADGYIGKAYSLPLATVPEVLTKLTCDVARYYLHFKGVDKDSPIQRSYDQALSYFRDVARGIVQLVETDTGVEPPQAGGGQVQFSASTKVFSRKSLKGY
jgi:phage gp36-like protein